MQVSQREVEDYIDFSHSTSTCLTCFLQLFRDSAVLSFVIKYLFLKFYYFYNLQSINSVKSSTHLTPYIAGTILLTIFPTLYIPMTVFITPILSLGILSSVCDVLYFLIVKCIWWCFCNILEEDEFGGCYPFAKFKPTSLGL